MGFRGERSDEVARERERGAMEVRARYEVVVQGARMLMGGAFEDLEGFKYILRMGCS